MKRALCLLICLSLVSVFFTSCDPIYPNGSLNVGDISPLSLGETVEINIIYPETGGSIVTGWKDANVCILEGNDVVSISGMTVSALKPGTAILKISATTILTEDAQNQGYTEKTYSTEAKIIVE